jgi:hypothetical protein
MLDQFFRFRVFAEHGKLACVNAFCAIFARMIDADHAVDAVYVAGQGAFKFAGHLFS